MRGKFILFEGTDSCGKKTQATLLAEKLKKELERDRLSYRKLFKKK
jgi:thymidylate kinase